MRAPFDIFDHESRVKLHGAFEFGGPAFRKIVVSCVTKLREIYTHDDSLSVKVELHEHESVFDCLSELHIVLLSPEHVTAWRQVQDTFGAPSPDYFLVETDDDERPVGLASKLLVFPFHICLNCYKPKTQHVKDQCLFQSTKFLPEIR